MNDHKSIILKLSSENADYTKISDAEFSCRLRKDIHNVRGVKLKNASIPFTWHVIDNTNNDIYWKTLNTVNSKETIYNTKISPGTYTPEAILEQLCTNLTITELDTFFNEITWLPDTTSSSEIVSITKDIDTSNKSKNTIYKVSHKVSGTTTVYDFKLTGDTSSLTLTNPLQTIELGYSNSGHTLKLGGVTYNASSHEAVPLEYINCYDINENRLNITCRWNSLISFSGIERPKFTFNRKFFSFRMEKCLGIDETQYSNNDITDYHESVLGEYAPQPAGPDIIYIEFALEDTTYLMFTNSINSEDYSDCRIPIPVNCDYRKTIRSTDDIVYYLREADTVRKINIKIRNGDDDTIIGNNNGLSGLYSYFTFEFITE